MTRACLRRGIGVTEACRRGKWGIGVKQASQARINAEGQRTQRMRKRGRGIMSRVGVASFLAGCWLLVSGGTLAQTALTDAEYDIVIRGGRVLDGAGNPCIFADVGIKDGRYVKIGKIAGRGKTEIDAKGRYVSPGWID